MLYNKNTMEQEEQKVIISLDVVNKMLSFLSEKPYREVATLIDEVKKDIYKNAEEQKRFQEDKDPNI